MALMEPRKGHTFANKTQPMFTPNVVPMKGPYFAHKT